MITVKEITNKQRWEKFLNGTYKGFFPFFQTWNWGNVQKALGFSTIRLGIFFNNKLVGVAQVVIVKAKRGIYLHLRHGPVFLMQKKTYYKALMRSLREIAKLHHASFVRISPLIEEKENQTIIKSLNFHNAPIHNMDAEVCWILDITKPEEEILQKMRKSHRYLIKRALQGQIETLSVTRRTKDVDEFLELYKKLATKKHFVGHRGLLEELEILGKENEALLLLAKYDQKVIGGALIDFTGNMAIYHHGATDDLYKNLSVSYLLQWYALLEAKKRGKKLYNFWGIAPTDSKNHPWQGLTLFKTGFGGERKVFSHAKDLPLNMWYIKTYLIELISRLRKGY